MTGSEVHGDNQPRKLSRVNRRRFDSSRFRSDGSTSSSCTLLTSSDRRVTRCCFTTLESSFLFDAAR